MFSFSRKNAKAEIIIIMRSSGRAWLLKRALNSVLMQKYKNWHLMLMNDGGEEIEIRDLLKQIKFPFEKVTITSASFIGKANARLLNMALRKSCSEYVAIHDDDDTWDENFLEKTLKKIKEENSAAVLSSCWQVTERWNGVSYVEVKKEIYNSWQTAGVSLFRLAESNTFAPIAMLYRRAIWKKFIAYPEDIDGLEDWWLALKIFSTYEVPFINDVLASYHLRDSDVAMPGDTNFTISASKYYALVDNKIRNRLLIEDLRRGQVGLGFLVNMAKAHGQIFQKIHHLEGIVNKDRKQP